MTSHNVPMRIQQKTAGEGHRFMTDLTLVSLKDGINVFNTTGCG